MRVVLQHGNAGVLAIHDHAAPVAMLVRPGGAVLTDSLHPFRYRQRGSRTGLAECWRRIVANWRDPGDLALGAVAAAARGDLAGASVVPYLTTRCAVGESRHQAASHAVRPRAGAVAAPRRHAATRPRTSRAPAITSASWR